jgi:hypothetical protein
MPGWLFDSLLTLGVAFLLFVYVSWRATRLDRLHVRVETARAALDAALVRRAAVSLELAASRLLDPATSLVLATAAHEARTADTERREFAESDLSKALRAVAEQPGFREMLLARGNGTTLLEELDDAVATTRTARRRPLVRIIPLAGRAPLPDFFEIDDDPPA